MNMYGSERIRINFFLFHQNKLFFPQSTERMQGTWEAIHLNAEDSVVGH